MINQQEQQKNMAQQWFKELRDMICQTFEDIEQEYTQSTLPAGHFTYKKWQREQQQQKGDFGGGTMGLMKGRVFEKVGVNISTVYGQFDEEFAHKIPGALENDGRFWAAGISLVAHMHSPKVPAIHMNTRMISTSKTWFGGGTDLNTALPDEDESAQFHGALKQTCDAHDASYYPKYKQWCDEYFFIPHRNKARGQGGIFYDSLASGDWQKDFAFTQDVGRCFHHIYPALVRQKLAIPYTQEELEKLHQYRGLYAEFNLLYDRGTKFGLMTGGNIEAILMSLPPIAKWA